MPNPNVNSSECATKHQDLPNPNGRKNCPITPRDGSIQTQGQQNWKDEESEEKKEFTEKETCAHEFRSNFSLHEKKF